MRGGLGARPQTGCLHRTSGVGLRAERLRKGPRTPETLRSPLVGQPQPWEGGRARPGSAGGRGPAGSQLAVSAGRASGSPPGFGNGRRTCPQRCRGCSPTPGVSPAEPAPDTAGALKTAPERRCKTGNRAFARAGRAEPGLRRREAESGRVSGDEQRLTGTSGRRPASCESGETAGAGGGGPGRGSGEGAGPAEALSPACRRLGFGRDPAVPLRGPGRKHGELPRGRMLGAAAFYKQNVVYDESDCRSLLPPATVGMSLTT